MKEGLAEEARWQREGVEMESRAARAGKESRADGRMRGLIKPYYHQHYHCHDHRNQSGDEAYYVKRWMQKDPDLTDEWRMEVGEGSVGGRGCLK